MTIMYIKKLFYCDLGVLGQKGKNENNHKYIRRYIPKKISFNDYTQDEINVIVNHINSVKRDSL